MSENKSNSFIPWERISLLKIGFVVLEFTFFCNNESYTNIIYPALPFCKHTFHLDLFQYCCADIDYSILVSLWTCRLRLWYDLRCMFDITCRSYELR